MGHHLMPCAQRAVQGTIPINEQTEAAAIDLHERRCVGARLGYLVHCPVDISSVDIDISIGADKEAGLVLRRVSCTADRDPIAVAP